MIVHRNTQFVLSIAKRERDLILYKMIPFLTLLLISLDSVKP